MMLTSGLDANRRLRGGAGGGRRNAWARNMGEGSGVIPERGLGGEGGYDFKGGGREQRSLCGEWDRIGDGRIWWYRGVSIKGTGNIMAQSIIYTYREGA